MKINISINLDIDDNDIINIIKKSISNSSTIVDTKDNPNDRYDPNNTLVATFNSIEDVDTFCNKYNHDNKYNGLKVGQRIQIDDGTYNKLWYIAGFDVELSQKAADGKSYDNGYGIALVPETQLTTEQWNTTNTTTGGYLNSYMNKTVLVTVANNLKKVLSSHLVNRNVLLSSSVSGDNANAYKWTTAYCTLMSIGQMTGTFASHNNKYDDGEANYKLPLFNFMDYWTGSYFWSRGICTSDYAWNVYRSGGIDGYGAYYTIGVRPLVYIR